MNKPNYDMKGAKYFDNGSVDFGRCIRVALAQKDISQKEFAQAVDISEAAIINQKKGRVSPTLPVIMAYADFFGMKVSDFIALGESE